MEWPTGKFGAIYADPPWSFDVWSKDTGNGRSASAHYQTMDWAGLESLSVADLAAENCCLFCWVCWPSLPQALRVIEAWGFEYKTCGFDWAKAWMPDDRQIEMMPELPPIMPKDNIGMGYWTRANTEPCLLATRGKPKRNNADVRMLVMEPRREHSRKPDCVYDRIERLVDGPYLELFARTQRPGWTAWGNQVGKFAA